MHWFRRRSSNPSRRQLIDRKHRLEGEIRMLAAEVRRLQGRGVDVGSQEAQLARLRSEHLETRLAIDRAPID
jgi:hypothetical protein